MEGLEGMMVLSLLHPSLCLPLVNRLHLVDVVFLDHHHLIHHVLVRPIACPCDNVFPRHIDDHLHWLSLILHKWDLFHLLHWDCPLFPTPIHHLPLHLHDSLFYFLEFLDGDHLLALNDVLFRVAYLLFSDHRHPDRLFSWDKHMLLERFHVDLPCSSKRLLVLATVLRMDSLIHKLAVLFLRDALGSKHTRRAPPGQWFEGMHSHVPALNWQCLPQEFAPSDHKDYLRAISATAETGSLNHISEGP
mmetsp:Transcript_53555/g.148916  ORF Transcript_53555/g.148916 Transcript_53555/m.148916 type:complete len:247 (-) Transcript_53555:8-748(-)